jgi:putative transcriptional regulator
MNAIRPIRERLQMTQQAMADALGCTQGNVGHYERGQTIPPDVAKKLIEVAAKRGLRIGYDHVYGAASLPPEKVQSKRKSQAGEVSHG